MPTGAGKSLCYQIPALLQNGVTVVISPLISLMKDQVGALREAGVAAAFLNSTLLPRQRDEVLADARAGRLKLLYVAPERLSHPDFISFAQGAPIPLVAVDEAHCVSQWGHDFRPSYLRIADFLASLTPRPAVGAFTATATQKVRDDITDSLRLQSPQLLVSGFNRPNLFLAVRRPRDRDAELLAYVKSRPHDAGIVYCMTRKEVESVCELLREAGVAATRYHAGLTQRERHASQDDFLYDRATVMVATNAFGMGIDKSDVRFVLHYHLPLNLEAYYQEAGRAGRDGEPADCILFYQPRDVPLNRFLLEKGAEEERPDLDLATGAQPADFARVAGLGNAAGAGAGGAAGAGAGAGVNAAVTLPADAALFTTEPPLDEAERLVRLYTNRALLRQMIRYATTTRCLRYFILNYFGERGHNRDGAGDNGDGSFMSREDSGESPPSCPDTKEPSPLCPQNSCGNCGNCRESFAERDITIEAQKLLSCVYRVRERLRDTTLDGLGQTTICDVVRGKTTDKVVRWQLQGLSTFGIMADLSVRQIRQILDFLLEEEYLLVAGDRYPVLLLGPRADEVLRERQPVTMRLPKGADAEATTKSAKSSARGARGSGSTAGSRGSRADSDTGSSPAGGTGGHDPDTSSAARANSNRNAPTAEPDPALLSLLKEERNRWARLQDAPAYIVFSNATLKDMCLRAPTTHAQFLEVKGVGETKAERYADAFTAVVREYLQR
jgi:ATP-dependent DNA helicase RecQ